VGIYFYICKYIYLYLLVSLCAYICACTSINCFIYTYIHEHIHIIYRYIYIHTCTYSYTYIYTFGCARVCSRHQLTHTRVPRYNVSPTSHMPHIHTHTLSLTHTHTQHTRGARCRGCAPGVAKSRQVSLPISPNFTKSRNLYQFKTKRSP